MKKVNTNENKSNEKKNAAVDETPSSDGIIKEIKEINKNIEKIFNFFEAWVINDDKSKE